MSQPANGVLDLTDDLPGPNAEAAGEAAAREAQLTKPAGALGHLEGLTQWLAAWQGPGTAPAR